MKSLISKCIGLFWFILFFSSNLQSQVTVTLIQPPPNQWHIEDLWNLSLFNAGETLDVYLRATVEEVNRGLVFDGNSSKFELESGSTGRIDPYSLEPIRINHNDPDIEELVLRLGKLPPGTFTVCVSVNDASNDEELARDCYTQVIIQATPPELVSPANKIPLITENPVFTWLPSGINSFEDDVEYSLIISEIVGAQTPYEAMNTTPYFFKGEDIRTTVFQYPIVAQNFEPEKQYAWQVISYVDGDLETGRSEIWTFKGKGVECEIKFDSLRYECIGSNTFRMYWYITNPNTNTAKLDLSPGCRPISVNISGNPIHDPDVDNQTITIDSNEQIQGTTLVTFDSPIHEICLTATLTITYDDNSQCKVSHKKCFEEIDCNNCCEDFKADIFNKEIVAFHSPSTPSVDEILISDAITISDQFTKVNAEIIEYNRTIEANKECLNCCCNKDHRSYGTFIHSDPLEAIGIVSNKLSGTGWLAGGAPVKYTTAGAEQFSREVVWQSDMDVDFSNGIKAELVIGVPEYNKCGCVEIFNIKIRYTFTDKDCKTCDVVVDYNFDRTPENTKFLEK